MVRVSAWYFLGIKFGSSQESKLWLSAIFCYPILNFADTLLIAQRLMHHDGPMKYCCNNIFTVPIHLLISGCCESGKANLFFFLFPYKPLHPLKWWSDRFLNRTGSSLIAEYTNSAHFKNKCILSAQTKNSSYGGQLYWEFQFVEIYFWILIQRLRK